MAKDSFEKMDKFWSDKLDQEKKKEISPELLKNFSQSVEDKLRAKEAKKFRLPEISLSGLFRVRTLVPVLAVMVLASIVAIRLPMGLNQAPILENLQMSQAFATPIESEIAALKELGVWTDDDETAVDLSSIEDLEVEASE